MLVKSPCKKLVGLIIAAWAVLAMSSCGGGGGDGGGGPNPPMPPVDTTAPVITIGGPDNGAAFRISAINVSGTVDDIGAQVTVNGQPVDNDNGVFQVEIILIEGGNTIIIAASDSSGNTASKEVTVTWDVTNIVSVETKIEVSVDAAGGTVELPNIAEIDIPQDAANGNIELSAIRMTTITDLGAELGLELHGSVPTIRLRLQNHLVGLIGVRIEIPDLATIRALGKTVELAVLDLLGSDLEGTRPELLLMGGTICPDGVAICVSLSPNEFMSQNLFEAERESDPVIYLVPIIVDDEPISGQSLSYFQKDQATRSQASAAKIGNWQIWDPVGTVSPPLKLGVLTTVLPDRTKSATVTFDFTLNPNISFASDPLKSTSIFSPFGWRNSGSGWHGGLDLTAGSPTDVLAMHTGTLSWTPETTVPKCEGISASGNYVRIKQADQDWETRYLHMSEQTAWDGSAGKEIGKSGNSGRKLIGTVCKKYPSHLHVDLRLDASRQKLVDPAPFLSDGTLSDILKTVKNAKPAELPAMIVARYGKKLISFELAAADSQSVSLTFEPSSIAEWQTGASDTLELEIFIKAPRIGRKKQMVELPIASWTITSPSYSLYLVGGAGAGAVVPGTFQFPSSIEWQIHGETIHPDGSMTSSDSVTPIDFSLTVFSSQFVCQKSSGDWVERSVSTITPTVQPAEPQSGPTPASGETTITTTDEFSIDVDGNVRFAWSWEKIQRWSRPQTFPAAVLTRNSDAGYISEFKANLNIGSAEYLYDYSGTTDFGNDYDPATGIEDWTSSSLHTEFAAGMWPADFGTFHYGQLTFALSILPGDPIPEECQN